MIIIIQFPKVWSVLWKKRGFCGNCHVITVTQGFLLPPQSGKLWVLNGLFRVVPCHGAGAHVLPCHGVRGLAGAGVERLTVDRCGCGYCNTDSHLVALATDSVRAQRATTRDRVLRSKSLMSIRNRVRSPYDSTLHRPWTGR